MSTIVVTSLYCVYSMYYKSRPVVSPRVKKRFKVIYAQDSKRINLTTEMDSFIIEFLTSHEGQKGTSAI